MAKSKVKYVYVLTQEYYHFPPNDSDMVAATPRAVYPGHDAGRISAQVQAKEHAQEYCNKFGGEVKEFRSESGRETYRVWIDSPNPNCDKFVWVVRRVDYVG